MSFKKTFIGFIALSTIFIIEQSCAMQNDANLAKIKKTAKLQEQCDLNKALSFPNNGISAITNFMKEIEKNYEYSSKKN